MGVVREIYPHERRVALTPQNAALLLKKGFKRVLVERGAGAEASFPDEAYKKVGATLTDAKNVWAESDILVKVRSVSSEGAMSEVDQVREGTVIISFSMKDKNIVEKLGRKRTTTFAMDMIPRISRAQVFDALRYIYTCRNQDCYHMLMHNSSMANIAGYKAVLEASNHFGRFLTGQVTAAG